MKVGIISVGNSKGIRIPKAILEQCRFNKEAELEVQGNALLIKPVRKVREGWDKAFQLMHEMKEDALVINDSLDAEMESWEW
ncbi:MAG: AbrB/MazE/SpoVT family DNA-binding domain-containing protein [Nitrospirae bacterium]|nr:AbrB/MazE/SpoVT family DNA-binding domain-containing protein [Nitrospirota bacterium]